jgi:flagellar hook-associated protein 2
MAAISNLGIGSGLDLGSLLDRLSAAESQPLVVLKRKEATYTAKLSAYGTLQGALSSLQAAANKLADVKLFQTVKASSSFTDVLSASAASTGASGSYAVEVLRMAQAQSLAAAGVASATAPIGKGTITLDFGTLTGTLDAVSGTYSGAAFSVDASRIAKTVVIDDSNNSLEGLRDAINGTSGIGVTASIVNDGGASPFRLVLTATQSGQTSSMRINVSGVGSEDLQAVLNHDPAGTNGPSVQLRQTNEAVNALIKVNGLEVTSASNVVSEAIQGVTLNLAKLGQSTVAVSRDTAGVEAAINSLVTAYNGLKTVGGQLSRYDQETKSGAPLVGDSSLRNILIGVRAVMNTPESGELKSLSNIGVSFQKDGTLTFDAAKFRTAYAQSRDDVALFFSGLSASVQVDPGASAALGGFAGRLSGLVTGYTSVGGTLNAATAGINSTLKNLNTRYAAVELSVQAKIERYRAQFTQLDLMMARMNSTTSYLTQQFENMSASTK